MPYYLFEEERLHYFRDNLEGLEEVPPNVYFSEAEDASVFYNHFGECTHRVENGAIVKKDFEELAAIARRGVEKTLLLAKEEAIRLLSAYSNSPAVDTVAFGGVAFPVKFSLRGKLQEKIEEAEILGAEVMTFTLSDTAITFPVGTFKGFCGLIASVCFCVFMIK